MSIKPAYFEPGMGVQYSNSGYLLAGLVLDAVLGEHHSSALRNRVLIPLGLNDTYYGGVENELGMSISGYIIEDGEMENTKPFYESVGVADAPLVTTVSDLSQLLRAIMTDDSVVTDDIRELLIGEASVVSTTYGFDFGLGLFVDNINGQLVYHHGGAEVGYETRNLYFVDDDITVTLFSNCHGYSACDNKTDQLIQEVMAEL
jgi:D-alanyl-D-alanine carboxypeptidase